MKCELAAALLHRPTTLFLDEPTIGLDVAMQVAIRDFVRSYNQRHEATVLLTSHYMDDVVALCPRIIVIDRGQADPRRRPAPADQDDGSRQARVVHADRRRSPTTSSPSSAPVLARDGQRITLRGRRARAARRSSVTCSARCKAADLAIEDPPLEDILREMFGKRARRDGDSASASEAS